MQSPRLVSRSGWEVLVGVGVIVFALVWFLGGFRRAEAYLGQVRAVGELVHTRYWDVAVDRAGVLGSGGPTAIGLAVRLTNRTDQSRPDVSADVLMVKLADGHIMNQPSCNPRTGTNAGFDPDIETEAICLFSFAQNPVDPPTQAQTIRVIVLDQPPLDGRDPEAEPTGQVPPAAHVTLEAPWLVE